MGELDSRRDELLEIARGLFYTYGVRKTTLDEIARSAGISKSALYHYFSCKEDLVRAFAEKVFSENVAEFRNSRIAELPLRESVLRLMEMIVTATQRIHPVFLNSLEEILHLTPLLRETIHLYRQNLAELFRDRLELAIERKEVRNLPLDEITTLLMILLTHLVKRSFEPDHLIPLSGNPGDLVDALLAPYSGSGEA